MLRALVPILMLLALSVDTPAARQVQPFVLEESTIAAVHGAMKEGRLTCRSLVEQYLRRIAMYDRNGPALNALVLTNPRALAEPMPWTRARGRAVSRALCTACR